MDIQNNETLVYTVEEVQKMLGISRKTAYKMCNGTYFPVKRVGQKLLIPKASFIQWLNQNDN